ncbi:helix-turn-helix domain-containing protein [Paenibacillus sp. GCM10027626]|uniref:helix-turn-helix domain-containing protein n=1 Tax=Paenibacillus sp. GCM10027626 TaxID=3273411 RepID=UPI003626E3D7
MKIRLCGTGTLTRLDEVMAGGVHTSTHEILYIVSGKAKFRWNDRQCIAEAPAVFVILPSTPHQLESLSPEIKYRFLEITDIKESPLATQLMDDWNRQQAQNDFYSRSIIGAAILESFDWVHHLHVTGEARRHPDMEQVCLLEIRKIYHLISFLLGPSPDIDSSRNRTPEWDAKETVDQLINYMEWRYKEEITLTSLANLVHLNPSYLIRLFKSHTNVTPFEYLRDLRLKAAASLLSGSQMPIHEIAQETGIGSVHYFCRIFKKTYGLSPAEWRKQLRKGESGPGLQ